MANDNLKKKRAARFVTRDVTETGCMTGILGQMKLDSISFISSVLFQYNNDRADTSLGPVVKVVNITMLIRCKLIT